MATGSSTYNAKSITVLEGLEAVRRRPGMYIGGVDKTGLHHLLWEIVDNAVDEVMNGHATRIVVTLHADGKTMSVADNGRGIPVDIHPKTGKSALEVIFTTLHAGGKFDNDAYKVAGGLHGVGASVVNALSKSLIAEVRRDGKTYIQRYRRGKPQGPVEKGEPSRGTGTTVTFTPDPEIFQDARLRPGADRRAARGQDLPQQGPGDPVRRPEEQDERRVPPRRRRGRLSRRDQRPAQRPAGRAPAFVLEREEDEDGLRCHLALAWTEATDEDIRSFVNTIPTRDGGTHELGMLAAVGTAVQRFMETHDLVKKGMEIKREDIREGLTAVLAVCVHEPQFQGQTKGRLNNPEVKAQVESMIRPALENFLLKNKSVGDAIAARVIQAAKAREASRAAASQVRRKTAISGRLNLPGKLADCDSTNPEESELFIVEGDSAGGSAKQGRDRDIQAILPLRGKVLNAEQAGKAKVLDNKELTDLISALGCGMDDQYDPGRLRYGKVILLTDADSDGHHIATLLLTFFYRHVPGLFADGRIYLACPPLYKITWGKEIFWASDDAAPRPDPRQAPQERQAQHHPLQGTGRDAGEAPLRDDPRPRDPPAAPRRHPRRRSPLHRPDRQRPDGQGARGPLQVHHGRSLYGQGYRYLTGAVRDAEGC